MSEYGELEDDADAVSDAVEDADDEEEVDPMIEEILDEVMLILVPKYAARDDMQMYEKVLREVLGEWISWVQNEAEEIQKLCDAKFRSLRMKYDGMR